MARVELATFRLQGECSSQAELHWHDVRKDYGDLKCSQNYRSYQITLIIINMKNFDEA